jgi:hypothetical protein
MLGIEDIGRDFRRLIEDVIEASTEERLAQARRAHRLSLLAAAALAAPGDATIPCSKAVGLSRTALQAYALLTRYGPRELERLLVEVTDLREEFLTLSHLIAPKGSRERRS